MNMNNNMLSDDLLLGVQKPAQYIGEEWNVSRKDFDKAGIKFALCFPDLYEVGMSNLGLRIIYAILNNLDDVACERFFSPGTDLEKTLRNNQKEILSLESKRGLREFDIIGFSLAYELGYTNVLNILDLGGILLKSSARDEKFPLVIAGGPCALNPEPMHEFFDLFVVGEAEEAILEIIDIYRKFKGQFKAAKIKKQDLLLKFSVIEGVYVPSLYEVKYGPEGKIASFKPQINGLAQKIKKRLIRDFDNAYFPMDWLVPYIQTVHDRITLEIMRGCPNQCRFCQARQQYFPFRQRKIGNLLKLALESYKRTGYEDISLMGLSVSDYPDIEELLGKLIVLFKEKAVGLSLPSLKPKTMVGNMSSLIATIKKTGLTFAPEAATDRLRTILGKDFDIPDFFKAVEQAYLSGYQHLKLYFMIGLPFEEEKDLDGIVEFAQQVCELRRSIAGRPGQVNISINTLIPKPHTPFQWLAMEDLESVKYKQDYLKKKTVNKRKLNLSFHNRYMSFLEGVFSRGDRRLSAVILSAFKKGARFDAWGDYFKFDIWLDAFKEGNINPDFYLQKRGVEEFLPWDFLDIGLPKEALLREFNAISDLNVLSASKVILSPEAHF
jgi:radical SAM family uncharacterized protein